MCSVIYSNILQKYIDTDFVDELELVEEQAEPDEFVFRSEKTGIIYKF